MDRIANRALDVEREGVAELIGLGLEVPLMPDSRDHNVVTTKAIGGKLGVQIVEDVLADLAKCAGRQLECATLVVDEPCLLEHLGELGHLLHGVRHVITKQFRRSLEIDLCESAGVGHPLQHLFDLVEVAKVVHEVHGLTEIERVGALSVIALAPVHSWEHRLQAVTQLAHLRRHVEVAEQLVGQLLELCALLWGHRCEHCLSGRHLRSHVLEQLIEGFGVLRKEVAVFVHESIEVGLGAVLTLFDHLVEVGHHVAHSGHVLRRHR